MRDYDGIFPPYEAFYIESMHFITTTALNNVGQLNQAVHTYCNIETEEEHHQFDFDYILNPAQNLATQGAALSRYFWPSFSKKKLHEGRAKKLRSAFAIDESSALHSRKLRNALEHFDERLDAYFSNEFVGNVIPKFVGQISESEQVTTVFFRAFEPKSASLIVLGERFELSPIVEEIVRVHDCLEECRGNGRLPNN